MTNEQPKLTDKFRSANDVIFSAPKNKREVLLSAATLAFAMSAITQAESAAYSTCKYLNQDNATADRAQVKINNQQPATLQEYQAWDARNTNEAGMVVGSGGMLLAALATRYLYKKLKKSLAL